jgi:hypothetical protein
LELPALLLILESICCGAGDGYQQNPRLARAWLEKSVSQGGKPRGFLIVVLRNYSMP